MEKIEKKAILVVSFGTSFEETRDKNITAIENEIANAWQDWEVRRAFTSGMILKVLWERDSLHIDNVDEAMRRLVDDGFTKIFVQPTHILNGDEFDKMLSQVKPYENMFSWIRIGKTMLSESSDYEAVCNAIYGSFPELSSDDALVLMGHGTGHFADSAYAALDYRFKALGHPNVFVGTVEGFPELSDIIPQVEKFSPKKILLLPLMIVAGDHALNDMAGEEDDSWKKQFEEKGYEVECFLRGLGEIPDIRKLYLQHVEDGING